MAFNYAKRTEHLPLLDQKMLASPRSTRPRRSPQLLPATGRTGLVACLPPVYAGPGPGDLNAGIWILPRPAPGTARSPLL